ncbi:MAG: patatin-like phospholipase family protein [Gammaproteobacteria bacterium]|nr:patatin-like phospholipase family protein [Gammaproteobacteria bacterium]
MREINTLVFEGGSVKGLAYVGALQVLDLYSLKQPAGRRFLDQIERVAGTSAGSIMALLIALNLDLEQIKIIMQNTSFSSFADITSWHAFGSVGKGAAIYSNGYLCEGLVFLNWVKSLLATHAGNQDVTFKELRDSKGKDLHIYAVRLNNNEIVTFNAEKTPNVSVALAVRMSMSIPVFFKPVRVTESYDATGCLVNIALDEANGTSYYVDGGVKINYPYPLIKASQGLPDEKILGFKVDSSEEIFSNAVAQGGGKYLTPLQRERTKIKDGFGMHLIGRMLTALMSPQDDAHNTNPAESSRTIRCWDCNVSTFDFALNQEKIDALLASGASAAHTFIGDVSVVKEIRDEITILQGERVEDVGFAEQMEAVKTVPETAVRFAGEYGQKEAERLSEIASNREETARVSGISLSSEEQQSVEALKADIERLKGNMFRIRQELVVKGKIEGDAKLSAANVTDVPSDLEFFQRAIAHVQTETDKGIWQTMRIEGHGAPKNAILEAANISFASPDAKTSSAVKEESSVLIRRGMYSPIPLNILDFLQVAEEFLAEVQANDIYKENRFIQKSCSDLKGLIDTCGFEPDKSTRDQIRTAILQIEKIKTNVDATQKKVQWENRF